MNYNLNHDLLSFEPDETDKPPLEELITDLTLGTGLLSLSITLITKPEALNYVTGGMMTLYEGMIKLVY